MKILELLQKAKKLYLENQGKCGMCWCIKVIANEGKIKHDPNYKDYVPYSVIVSQIPEFNPYFFGAPIIYLLKSGAYFEIGLDFWWDVNFTEPRINAFDKLIKVYENSNKKFMW